MKTVKSVSKSIWSIFCAIGQARYAAEMARNGKYTEAQAYYKN